jgi:flagellar hook assembly protein FlgD
VTLAVYDVGGHHVTTLLDAAVEGGIREAVWDGTDERGNRVSSGIYFYRLRVGERTLVKRMLLLK